MKQITEDLWETSIDTPMPGLTTHAYLWTPPSHGSVLFYSVATDREFDELDRLGGVAHQYLSHRDEAGPMLDTIGRWFGAALHASPAEITEVGRHRQPDVLFDGHHRDDQGVEVIPTPGHSPGSTCFVVEGAAGRYLFTGDTLFRLPDGRWAAGYLGGISDADALSESLDLLAGLEPPELVISSAAPGGQGVHPIDPDAFGRCIDEARRSLPTHLRSMTT